MQNYFILLYLSFAETWTIQYSVSSSQGCQKGKSQIDGRLEIMLWLLFVAKHNLCSAWAFSQSLLLPLPLQNVLFVCIEYELFAYKGQLASYLACFLCGFKCLGNSASASIIVGSYIPCGFIFPYLQLLSKLISMLLVYFWACKIALILVLDPSLLETVPHCVVWYIVAIFLSRNIQKEIVQLSPDPLSS